MPADFSEIIDQIGPIGQNKKYSIVTLGCQMNEHDSEVMAAMLESIGYDAADAIEESDLIIINTCAVRKKPEEKVASLLGKYSILKQEKNDLIIAVGGCMSQLEESAQYLKKRFSFVNLIFGTHALPRLPYLILQAMQHNQTVIELEDNSSARDGLPVLHKNRYHAWLPIIYGCNNYCSYCIVPYVRGPERSRPKEMIISEARSLVEKGFVEVTLLGQNVNSYGLDLNENQDFADLLYALNDLDGLYRIRFMTSHPKDLSPQLIDAVKDCDKVCEHFHLPVQSGSNRVLKKMNRSYTREYYLGLLQSIRNAVPDLAVTSDIIVGFPGEEETDFRETLDLIDKARFDNAFTFIYSPRKGTAAYLLDEPLSHSDKENRLKRVNELQHHISAQQNQRLHGKTLELLVEGSSKYNSKMQSGRTRTNKLVHFAASKNRSGQLIKVKITEARTWNLIGELVSG